MKVFDGGGDAFGFIARRYDYAKQLKRFLFAQSNLINAVVTSLCRGALVIVVCGTAAEHRGYNASDVWSHGRSNVEPVRVLRSVTRNLVEDGRKITFWPPVKPAGRFPIIHNQPWNVEGARCRVRCDRMFTKTLRAPACELGEGHGIHGAASDIEDGSTGSVGDVYLACDELSQIIGMKRVSDLPAGAVKADIL